MKRVLITGGAGFIGLHLARRLAGRGVKIIDLLDDFSRAPRDNELAAVVSLSSVRVMELDLRNADALADLGDDYSYIFHLAAIVGVAPVVERPYDVLEDNVAMTGAALALGRRQRDLRRFVFASTSEVYAGASEGFDLPIPTPEETPLALPDLARPRTAYMLSKVYGEALCRHSGLPFTIVRPHNVYGPRMGMVHVIPELLQRARNATAGDGLAVYSVDHTRTFCFIDDAVEMIRLAAEREETEREVLNVGAQEPEVTIGQLASIILDVVGKDVPINPRPAARGSPRRRCPDMTKCARLTGYHARVGLRKGIAVTYDWYREKVFEPAETASPGRARFAPQQANPRSRYWSDDLS